MVASVAALLAFRLLQRRWAGAAEPAAETAD